VKLVAVDLFCGAGGLSLGLEQAGFVVPVGYDIDPVCKPAFEQKGKRRFECQDISTLSAELVAKEFKGADVRLLAGCAPCQTFSTYSRGSRLAPSDDKRWSLIDHFGRIVKDVLPEFVTMENVPRAALYKSYNDFVLLLESLKYNVYHEVVDCSEIGLPQQRKRRVLIASRVSETPIVSKKEKKRTVRDAIYHLPKLEAGESSKS
jgi:DNA (cytosine-5)-methyltransferase 1